MDKVDTDERTHSTRCNEILNLLPEDILLVDETPNAETFTNYFLEAVELQLALEMQQQTSINYSFLEKVLNMFGHDWDKENSDTEEGVPGSPKASTTATILKFPGQSAFKSRMEQVEQQLYTKQVWKRWKSRVTIATCCEINEISWNGRNLHKIPF